MSSEADMLMIPFSKIDAAWKSAWDEDSLDWRWAAERALEEIGIMRCKECGGEGVVDNNRMKPVSCVPCGGHGWISGKTLPLNADSTTKTGNKLPVDHSMLPLDHSMSSNTGHTTPDQQTVRPTQQKVSCSASETQGEE